MVDQIFIMPLPAAKGCLMVADRLVENGIPEQLQDDEESEQTFERLKDYCEFLRLSTNTGPNPVVLPEHHKNSPLGVACTAQPEVMVLVILLKSMGML